MNLHSCSFPAGWSTNVILQYRNAFPILPDAAVVNCGTLNFSQFFDSHLYCVNEKLGEGKIVVHDQHLVRFVVFAQPGKLCDIVGQLSKLHTYVVGNTSIELFLLVVPWLRTFFAGSWILPIWYLPTRGRLSKAVESSFDSIGFELGHVVLTCISGLLSWIFRASGFPGPSSLAVVPRAIDLINVLICLCF